MKVFRNLFIFEALSLSENGMTRRAVLHGLTTLSQPRWFSSSTARAVIRPVTELPKRIAPIYHENPRHELLSLQWTTPLRNVLITKKEGSSEITEATLTLARHIQSTYPGVSLIFEPSVAAELHSHLEQPVFMSEDGEETSPQAVLPQKVDLICTLGGDGTILRAGALFARTTHIPPLLSFSMGTLGFLGEWKFPDFKQAFREVYMSGASAGNDAESEIAKATSLRQPARLSDNAENKFADDKFQTRDQWSTARGKSMGHSRAARVLLRNRLQVGILEAATADTPSMIAAAPGSKSSAMWPEDSLYAMNEVILHRGRDPHLAMIEIWVGGRFLTEAVGDGMIVSTPTGSTAYSLSSGGSIVHPLVDSLLVTPICPRSLSFRPLVLPSHTRVTLKLSDKNRANYVDVSIDGVRQVGGLTRGGSVQVQGEQIQDVGGQWVAGVPSIVRGASLVDSHGDDHWVGGLNGLLKFNYPFGENE